MHSIQISAVHRCLFSSVCIQEWATHGVLYSKNNQIDGMSWDPRCLEVHWTSSYILSRSFQEMSRNDPHSNGKHRAHII